jgi:NhaP-type Na+/H+ or K+/H+ antiporter
MSHSSSKIGVPENDFGLNLFIVVLAFGVFVRTVCGKKIRKGKMKEFANLFQTLPYTVWVLMFGVGIGCIDLASRSHSMEKSVYIWQNIDVHVMLFVFLPALLFQSSFSIDPHIIRHEAVQIFCLAGPGVLVSTFLIASFVKFYYTTFSWNLALLVGGM